ncbi:baseplate J/gp47 family protein [uncultured Aquimarina sp.]|uniref:baseplate J/gp47 family protein n=1 Tax=uncultured Aquimarina sp. TaxID=575652 RepID=UPI002604FC54|nr:baseplate J/gp47 family protein [uncultured Aquimarina sp.]
MSENCLHSNPLRRDGTSQQQRTLNTLLPSYVAVDERSMKDVMEFIHAFGEEIRFYDDTNAIDGHWADFFKITDEDWASFSLEAYLEQLKIDQFTKPHLALFFGFLYMFKIVQEDINTITERHLDFYYKEVLQLEEKAAEPDKVSIIFELAKHVESHLLKAGTALKAGKDNTGANVTYKLNEDTVINKAQVAEIKAQFTNLADQWASESRYPTTNHRVYSSPIANSADGLGAEIETEEKDWRVFGRPLFVDNEDNPTGLKIADRKQGEIGFAIASPILFLAEGQRKIDLEVVIDFKGDENNEIDIQNKIQILLSGKEEWIETMFLPGDKAIIKFIDGVWKMMITTHLKVDQPAVLAYNNEVYEENINTKWPVLKLLINSEDPTEESLYKELINVSVDTINLTVEIDGEIDNIPGVQNFIAQNDQSVLDPTKPLQIFGGQPHLGSKFYIGSKEVFQKKLDYISLKFQWVDLPQDAAGFSDYYLHYHYPGVTNSRNNSTFKIKTEVLTKKEWETVSSDAQLFTDASGTDITDNTLLPSSESKSKITNSEINLSKINRYPEIEDFEEFDASLTKGFMRFSLKGTEFGHKDFQNSYSYHAIKIANGFDWTLPNPPYVPTIEGLSIYYKSSVEFNLNNPVSNEVEQFFHLEPFGNYEVVKTKVSKTIFPTIEEEGNLFIGLENLNSPQTLSLLIQVAEGSANPKKEKQEVTWYYLSENNWLPFDQYTLLSDGTNGLLTSGIIKLDIQRTISIGNSRLSPDLYWLKASVAKYSDAVCDIIDIKAQAISASFVDQDNDPKFLENALEAGTISKLLDADASVKKIEQPYASSDGKPPEKEKAFYTRVSERLRHKNRAITIWDYEHLILEEFPKVYKVKCVNHTSFDGTITDYSETAPGHVSVVVIANVQNKNAVDPLRPLASLDQLSEIASFIDKIKPPCVILHVKNPIYEEIKVDFKVKFNQGIDAGYYISKLVEEIRHFLSPWSSDCATDIVFGGRIHKSVILNFVEERSYVDYVTCFKMFHIIKDDSNVSITEVDEALAQTSVSIIGSARTHTIEEIAASEADQCKCDDNIILSTEELTAIDNC